MKIRVPEKLYKLAQSLPKPLFVVGGACRDALAGLTSADRDWDICAPIYADEVVSAAEKVGLKVLATYKNTGTVRMSADGESAEFTCFRTDRYIRGVHSPAEVTFTDDMASDARRRDFKCNAVYYDILADNFRDPLGGIEDIENRRLTTVAPPVKVFGEDGLRLMRLARIAAQTGFSPSPECVEGAAANAELIKDIAPERIWTELDLILHADLKYGIVGGQYAGLTLLKRTGVLEYILPELALGDGMEQRKDYHDYDVLEHSLRAVLYAPPSIRLAALLHDAGKPYCKLNFGKYHRHEEYGKQIALDICARLRVPKKLAERVAELTALHMYDLSCGASENKIRKFIVNHYAVLEELLELKQADFSACKDDPSEAPCVKKWRGIIARMEREGAPFTLKQLAVKGNDLIEAGVPPERISATLKFLLEQTAMNCVENDRDKLLAWARQYLRD